MMKLIKLLCLVMLCSLITACQESSPIKLLQEKFRIELGNPIQKEAKYYLDMLSYNSQDYQDILNDCAFEVDSDSEDMFVQEGHTSYEKSGTYKAKLTYLNESINFEITVQDTRAPQIQGPNMISLQIGEVYDYQKDFTSADYSQTSSIRIDSSKVDVNTEGQYPLYVTSQDMYGNRNTKHVTVTVGESIELPQSVKLDIPYYNQLDEGAPMGCETTSVYMALQYKKKINIDIKEFINNEPRAESPYDGFVGDPFSSVGNLYGTIFPTPLIQYTSQYTTCYDLSGATVEDIQYQLYLDNPVVVYVTGGFSLPLMNTYYFGTVTANLHIVLLSGYDKAKGIFYVEDPITRNIKEVSFDDFYRAYELMKYAISIE